ncbi:zinc finger protein CONSTANS-LIKE 1-like [Cynara cardunculus var. scolymus]|uniref:Zinc finger, B-box n=1 Tax=Cynara cardunculus var. scolymus TaxID=59895 RepID=A0A103Y7X2_CYNCS|nr:zinc finger protein CONSTANS-LIKE 1-like [Cynara cardunculus var. scolymus]KVI04161.1 Zinc finger, B-box [Cynara cardunculus var. scolymus]
MKKRCELCKSMARVYCDSDSASLCWSCDAKVHSANFLVARHSRSLLCQICQSPTPWSASGEKIGPTTASICGRCVVEGISDDDDDREERVEGNDSEIGTDSDDEYDGDELELEDSVDGNDNQVVPWSSTPPPPAASSSSSEEFSISDRRGFLKRKRQNDLDLTSEDEIDSSSVNINHNTRPPPIPEPAIGDETTSFHSPTSTSTSESTVGKQKRIRHQNPLSGNDRSAPVISMIKSTKPAEMAFNSSDSP